MRCDRAVVAGRGLGVTDDAINNAEQAPLYYVVSVLVAGNVYTVEHEPLQVCGDPEGARAIVHEKPGTFVDRLMADLFRVPQIERLLIPFEQYAQLGDEFERATEKQSADDLLYKSISFDISLKMGRPVDALLSFVEVSPPPHHLVLVSFDLELKDIDFVGGDTDRIASEQLRSLLFAVCDVSPVLIGTVGLELDAMMDGMSLAGLAHEGRLALPELLWMAWQAQHGAYDLIVVAPEASGADRPFVADRLLPTGGKHGKPCYELQRLYAVLELHDLAEQAYREMYVSPNPQDAKDDALGYLIQAIDLLRSFSLPGELVLQERYDHIQAVYNAQFRPGGPIS